MLLLRQLHLLRNQLHTMKEETLRPSEKIKKSEAMVVSRPGSQMEEIGLMEQRD